MKRLQDRYVMVFGVVMVVAIVSQPVGSVLGSVARQADPARIGAGLALVAVAYAGYLALVRMVGPVVLSAADASWRLLSPLPRRTVLGKTAPVLLMVSVLGGLVLGVALVSVLGAPDQTSVRLVVGLVLGLAAGLGGMALGVLGQASAGWDGWLQALIAVTVVAGVLLAVLGSGPGRPLLSALADTPVGVAGAVAAFAATVSAFLVRRAWAALDRVPARKIMAASVRTGKVARPPSCWIRAR